MDSFKVVGSHKVAGVAPGGTVKLEPGPNTDALIWGGHVRKVAASAVPTKPPAGGDDEEVK